MDTTAAYELTLFMENDYPTYQQMTATDLTMVRRYVRGTFSADLAPKGYIRAVTAAARRYQTEHGSPFGPSPFTPDVRRYVAADAARDIVRRIRNYVLRGVDDLPDGGADIIDRARANGWRDVAEHDDN